MQFLAFARTYFLTMDELEASAYDRIQFLCPEWRREGFISGVWVSITRILLEGTCVSCQRGSLTSFDLLEVDSWIKE